MSIVRLSFSIFLLKKTVKSEYGVRYCVDVPVETPGGDRPTIRTVWIVEEGSPEPRLVTAYPV